MIRRRGRRGCWWFVAGVVSERGKMLTAVLALCCCVRLVAATPTEAPCPHGFHRVVETGLCCERCKPGQYVENGCTENNGPTTCRECPNGYYTAVENYLSGCWKCKECETGEEIVQTCTESSNTLCRCKAGFHRVDEFCIQDPSNATPTPTGATSGGKTAGIVVAVILLLFVAAAVAAFIYKKKGGRFPCEGEPGNSNQQELTAMGLLNWKAPIPETGPCAVVRDMDESTAAKLIKGKRPELKKWIGRDPTYLLDYLDSSNLISRDIYHGARDITGKVERANFLIDEFIDRNECLTLWRALESLQDPYPQLEEWISTCASTTHDACVTPTSGRRQDDSGSAGRLLDEKPSASESDADQSESQTTTQPGGSDGGQHGGAGPGGQRLNDPQVGVTPTSGRHQDDSGSAGRLLDGKPSASESDADQRESQTTTQPGGSDGGQRGGAGPGGQHPNDPQVGEKAPRLDANVQYSTTPGGEVAANEEAFRRLTVYSNEQLFDGMKKNMMALVEAIQGDVRPVLTKLFEKEIVTLTEMNAVSTTQTNNGGFNAASQLITMLLHKGDRVAREFWMALWNLKTNYPRIHKIIENVLLIIEPAN